MPRELTASDAWTRGLLILMSVGIAILTVLAAFGSMVSMDPQDHIAARWFLLPAGAAALGIVLAAFGGAGSRWASGVLGTLYFAVGVLGLASASDWWTWSRMGVAMAVTLCAIAALGACAIVLAIQAARASRDVRKSARQGHRSSTVEGCRGIGNDGRLRVSTGSTSGRTE